MGHSSTGTSNTALTLVSSSGFMSPMKPRRPRADKGLERLFDAAVAYRKKNGAREKVTGILALAMLLKFSRQRVCGWAKCPAEHVLKCAKVTKVPPHLIRPDLYPPPKAARRAPASAGALR